RREGKIGGKRPASPPRSGGSPAGPHTMRRRSLPGGSAMGNPGKHEKDGSMKAMVKFDGADISLRKKLKNQSKVAPEELQPIREELQPIWEEFQPIYLNGKVQFADCLHCHNRLGYNGDSFLRRHLKTCPAKPESTSAQVTEWMSPQDSCLPIGMFIFA
uniref:BED-type domain-containing protein n=1 Tax=Aegilops tauschii subsp. strangulata TaxID=200361 RepID=A0A453D1B6_AEGTS